jgi:hypothetical protein
VVGKGRTAESRRLAAAEKPEIGLQSDLDPVEAFVFSVCVGQAQADTRIPHFVRDDKTSGGQIWESA